jgi:antitoxin YefM
MTGNLSGTASRTRREERVMTAITASEARRTLFPLIEKVSTDHAPVEIVSKHGNAVLVSKEDWDSIEETAYLLRNPANAAWLTEGPRPGSPW